MNTRFNTFSTAALAAAAFLVLASQPALAQQKLDAAKSEMVFVSKQMGVPVEGKFRTCVVDSPTEFGLVEIANETAQLNAAVRQEIADLFHDRNIEGSLTSASVSVRGFVEVRVIVNRQTSWWADLREHGRIVGACGPQPPVLCRQKQHGHT